MSDYIVRATAANAQIRAFAATTREMVEKGRQVHETSPVMTAALGRLLTAGAMMGSMLKGEQDVLTLQIRGDGPAKGITVTADSAANVKGYVVEPQVMLPPNEKGKLDVGGAIGRGYLSVIKDMGLKVKLETKTRQIIIKDKNIYVSYDLFMNDSFSDSFTYKLEWRDL
jgi:molecular chaperone Hsp33